MDILKDLGFTLYQTKVLSALIKIKKAQASEIARISKVPANKVYQTIADLTKENIIMEAPTKPKLYSLINFDKYIKNKIKEKQENIYKLEDEYEKFILEYEAEENAQDFWILKDMDSLLKKIENRYETLENESVGVIEIWTARYSTLKITRQKIREGKKIRFIGKITKEVLPIVKKWIDIGVEIRHNNNIKKSGFAVFDNNSSKISVSDKKIKSIWSENEDLGLILKDYFEMLWEKSEEVDIRKFKISKSVNGFF